jgi:sortase A
MRPALVIAAWLLLLAGGAQFGSGMVIGAKAVAAQWLMERAWNRSQQGDARAKPWQWADTWPVARLRAPAADADLIVLAGISGRTLAFGPGWLQASSWPGRPGTVLIAGHRDTHFAFLQGLAADDLVELETTDGRRRSYRITRVAVVDSRYERLGAGDGSERLLLVTCYPFTAIDAGGPLRLVVEALPVSPPSRWPVTAAGPPPTPHL